MLKMNLTVSGGKMKSKAVVLILLVISIIGFSVTKDEIINLSKENPKEAWKLYLEYVLDNPTDTSLETMGKELKVKISLMNDPRLSFLIKQDIKELKNFLKNTTPSATEVEIIFQLFPQINEISKNTLEKPEYDTFLDNIILLKIANPEIDEKISAQNLTNFFLKYPTMLTYEVINILSQKDFSKDLGYNILKYIVDNIENFEEVQYPILNRIVEFAEKIGGKFTSKYLNDLKKYVELNNILNETSENIDINKAKLTIENLSIKKYNLSSKLENILNNTQKNNIKDSSKKTSTSQNSSNNTNYIMILLLVMLAIIVVSFKLVRFYLFYILGLKKMAAKVYKKIVDKDPLNEEKHLKLAQLYEEAGMYDKALEEYNILKRIKI
jgi:tetratricopeptide (TPR) repeat protein